MGKMEGRTNEGIKQKYSKYYRSLSGFFQPFQVTQRSHSTGDMYKPAIIANWKVWPAIQVCFHHCYVISP